MQRNRAEPRGLGVLSVKVRRVRVGRKTGAVVGVPQTLQAYMAQAYKALVATGKKLPAARDLKSAAHWAIVDG